jgi:hypothetical protein
MYEVRSTRNTLKASKELEIKQCWSYARPVVSMALTRYINLWMQFDLSEHVF